MVNQKAVLLAALLQIQQEVPMVGEGICNNVDMLILDVEGAHDLVIHLTMVNIWKKWPKYSGRESYPVPFTYPDSTTRDPMNAYYSTPLLWEGTYGDARKELLSYMIEQLQAETE